MDLNDRLKLRLVEHFGDLDSVPDTLPDLIRDIIADFLQNNKAEIKEEFTEKSLDDKIYQLLIEH